MTDVDNIDVSDIEGKMKPEEYDKLTIFERAVLEEFQWV